MEYGEIKGGEAIDKAREAAQVKPEYDPRRKLKETLKRVGINRRQLARELGICECTAYRWGKQLPVPQYAAAYLAVLMELNAYRRALGEPPRGQHG